MESPYHAGTPLPPACWLTSFGGGDGSWARPAQCGGAPFLPTQFPIQCCSHQEAGAWMEPTYDMGFLQLGGLGFGREG